MSEANTDSNYQLVFTGREVYWLIYLANKELQRLQNLPTQEGDATITIIGDRGYKPITDAFNKLCDARAAPGKQLEGESQ